MFLSFCERTIHIPPTFHVEQYPQWFLSLHLHGYICLIHIKPTPKCRMFAHLKKQPRNTVRNERSMGTIRRVFVFAATRRE